MKYYKCIAAVALLLATSAVSYQMGAASQKQENEKIYEDACHMSDLIRAYQDHLDEEDSDIQDWGCFEELCGIYLWDTTVADIPVRLEDYSWSY